MDPTFQPSPSPVPPPAYTYPPATSADLSHLKILAICHWVLGGLICLCGLFPIAHVVIGILIVIGKITPSQGSGGNPSMPPAVFGWIFIGLGLLIIVMMWILGLMLVGSGMCIHRRRRRMFSVVMAAIACSAFPLGTILGVFTLVVLLRDSVKHLYESSAPSAPAAA